MRFATERKTLEKNVPPDLTDMQDIMGWNIFSDVRLAIYYISEVSSGMLLNLLMMISGAGLMAPGGMGTPAGDRGRLAQDRALGRDDRRDDGPDPADHGGEDRKSYSGRSKPRRKRNRAETSRGLPMSRMGRFTAIIGAVAVVFSGRGGLGLPGALALVPDSPAHPRGLLDGGAVGTEPAEPKRTGRSRGEPGDAAVSAPLAGPECRRALARGLADRGPDAGRLAAGAGRAVLDLDLVVETHCSTHPSCLTSLSLRIGSVGCG